MLGFALLLAGSATRRVAIAVGGTVVNEFISVDITRDLEEMCASFSFTARSASGAIASLPYASMGDGPIRAGNKCIITIDGEPDMVGWVEGVQPEFETATITISGRDVACDVVDCPSDPKGKHEYKMIKLDEFARKVVKPFGLGVRVETDMGKPFDRMVIDAGETALSAIEKYARQRAVLVTSDGIGNILLTSSGKGAAAGAVMVPGNVLAGGMGDDWTGRFSHYFVKGQSEGNAGARSKTAPRSASANPSAPGAPPAPPKDHPEGPGTQAFGEAVDGAVTRWRPTIAQARTQAKNEDAKTQAQWAMRNARGKSETGNYTLADWRSDVGLLWRPNGLVPVADRFSGRAGLYLVAGVRRTYSSDGYRTELRIAAPEAYQQ